MGVSDWGVFCIAGSVLLCIIGTVGFCLGLKIFRSTTEERAKFLERQRQRGAEAGRGPRAHPLQALREEQEANQQAMLTLQGQDEDAEAPGLRPGVGAFLPEPRPAGAPDGANADPLAAAWDEEQKLHDEIAALEAQRLQYMYEWEGAVTVVELEGQRHEVAARSTDTVSLVKHKLFDIVAVQPQHLRLIYAGRELAPEDRTLQDLQIAQGAVLHLLEKVTCEFAPTDPDDAPAAPPPDDAPADPSVPAAAPGDREGGGAGVAGA
eukprot:TRINITY_DN18496_c0_g1_i1.p2 TRINITY_DN18496_c0_g1~~TRINITY_DN18496_c0_g1_i1.p2  ORF type:complete len:265 (+),score=114.86 TRINITY_DN18496_c0_g1_i1:85-879(+)